MLIKKITSAIVLFFSMIVFSYAIDSYVDEPTRKASELARKYAIANDGEKKQELDNLQFLSEGNPRNINVTRIYSSILSSRGEYEKAILVLNSFNKYNEDYSLMLQECMLKDRIGKYNSLCYGDVISLMRNKDVHNIDYLMALFLNNDKDFNKEREMYIKSTGNKQDLDAFNNGKKELLKNLYPN
ncbi:hypothetical protein EXT68_21515 [Pectobacterium parmentieri]|uniref:hypothetical protein n=1 Tax=Pectobacterium parmentieri TaxID=1905730 RepID=UPI000CDE31A7|nr:hypothetical protein [Pectobacterium parmentieri]AYH07268.1 hypothetical protein C5E25_18835 [Pectobacterium parmentieri]AYH16077.1 hypothetical protein C5E23_18770 [Pectobacterium parmentieri]AYH24787.1 hypothetical protein C5E21_18850 [Pectobacterium parmentieri]MBN3175991.1 hypothetical protein [Pectobacterium parmentieri]MCL6358005.1 hypothetical protein [Pectobacterium parmentieri]